MTGKIDPSEYVYDWWPWVHSLYEFSFNVTVLVTIYFWFVELPSMGARGDYEVWDWA